MSRQNSGNYPMRLDVHADDYGLSVHAAEQVVKCVADGKLDSISIMPNMSCFTAAIQMLKDRFGESGEGFPRCSVHLNFVEGHCLSATEAVPDLVDDQGNFKSSWGSLLLDSYRFGSRRDRIRRQLKTEIKAQIARVKDSLYPGYRLRIDSHQHTHMIPIVCDALIDAIREEQYAIEYIRIPEEPQWPYVLTPSLWLTYSPVNLLKNVVLNHYAVRSHKLIDPLNVTEHLVWGMVLSGEMDWKRMEKLWPRMARYMEKRDRVLEIIIHPARVLPEEIDEEFVKKGFVRWHLSENRDRERDMIYRLPRHETEE